MRQIEVRSNIAGDIMKIRKGVVYKEYATVIDELLQNCQRAGAENVQISIDGSTLIIADDGVGCEDPQSLFEKNTSAWMHEDEAFGEGFFSVFLIADQIRVRSHDWLLVVDVLEMMKTKNMQIDVKDGLPIEKGFMVELTGEIINQRSWDFRQEVRSLAPIMAASISLDKKTIEQKDLLDKPKERSVVVHNDIFDGVFTPSTDFSTIQYYYDGRPVREDYRRFITGKVIIKKGMATLKAPDRKEFIYDDKRRVLMDTVEAEIKNTYRTFLATATDDELDKYADAIEEYIPVEEYAEVLAVSRKLFLAKALEELENKEEQERQTAKIEVKRERGELPTWPVEGDMEPEAEDIAKDVNRPREKGLLGQFLAKCKRILYIASKDVGDNEALLREVEYAGFTILYAKNKLYEMAFAHYGVGRVLDFKDLIEEDHIITKKEPRSKKEQRFLALMEEVEKHFNLPEGTICLANLEKQTVLKATGEVLTKATERVDGLCVYAENRIYLDRRIIKFPQYRAQEPDYPSVTAHDYRVLLRVQQTLSHELAHLIHGYKDNTIEHAQAMNRIGYEIAELF